MAPVPCVHLSLFVFLDPRPFWLQGDALLHSLRLQPRLWYVAPWWVNGALTIPHGQRGSHFLRENFKGLGQWFSNHCGSLGIFGGALGRSLGGEGVAGQGSFQAPLQTDQFSPGFVLFNGVPHKTSFERRVLLLTWGGVEGVR